MEKEPGLWRQTRGPGLRPTRLPPNDLGKSRSLSAHFLIGVQMKTRAGDDCPEVTSGQGYLCEDFP